ncbi:MAG: hypothetical protein A3K19_13035 [Lentisphaerae bacterium RIFOXYB12_FULL_65_16]|nr:MAG: hypothetical protein A3K18_04670 [Lentisphaerae bacterium RIFOXYA12_64_32]OGV87235.1 MAG: hypothetical protein A3K19_13035 [Lentisphaerae bacterium RIFOXYB12_FULL_65_16]
MVRAVRHFGIVVRDMQAMLRFYRDLLGLTVQRDALESGVFVDTLLGLPGVEVRTVKLGLGTSGAVVELLEFRSHREAARAPRCIYSAGPTHLALTVDGLDAVYRELSTRGVRFISRPQTAPDQGARVAFCFDPEGTPVELVEVFPAP